MIFFLEKLNKHLSYFTKPRRKKNEQQEKLRKINLRSSNKIKLL